MGYLGLDQTEIKEDNILQRMFWPSDHPGESDTLGQQGFWVCFIIAMLSSLVLLLVHGAWFLALITLFIYTLAGVGVREHSQPAAILIAIAYILDQLAKLLVLGAWPGALDLIISLLLLANIRGTWIAAKWARADPSNMPERMNQSWTDKLVDQMPARVWPHARIPFFVIASLYVVLSIFGTVVLAHARPKRVVQSPSVELQVSPSR